MESIIVVIFVLGYLLITIEHPLKLDKTVPALLMAAIMWALLAIGYKDGWFDVINAEGQVIAGDEGFKGVLLHHFGKTCEILVFLIGAMTIVELIDLHRGFEILKNAVTTRSKRKLLWIIGTIAFFLSAMIDNLTATIVLVTLLRKLITNPKERMWYAGLVVIAANAGGAWSPIGDVTTTMLWIANKITTAGLIEYVIVPAIVCFAVPFAIASFLPVFKGKVEVNPEEAHGEGRILSSKVMLIVGLGAILSVPAFKTFTHLPPYMGMLFALGIVWLVSEYIHPEENFDEEDRHLYSAHKALSRIEISSILFFLGILMAVAGLEALVYGVVDGADVGTLRYLAEFLQNNIPNQDIVVMIFGVFSAIIDNVPLVAASMGMYTAPLDAQVWHFIAYSAGTGGSMLIIGSAAGVAAMGMEKIDFIWYLKKISWLAALGFLAGAGSFIFIEAFF